MRVRNRKLRNFVFGGKARKHKSRRGGKMAARMRNAPKHCKVSLGNCMRGSGGRAKAGKCMRAFHACIK